MKPRWTGVGGHQFQKSTMLPDGRSLQIDIVKQDEFALVNFYIDGSQKITGKGDAVAIFSTVINQLQDFVAKHRPLILLFSGSYDDTSRTKLYDRLTNRLVTTPAFKGYKNITDYEELWPEDLLYRADDIAQIVGTKAYVLASPQYLKLLGYEA
jgi:hypothetical protein